MLFSLDADVAADAFQTASSVITAAATDVAEDIEDVVGVDDDDEGPGGLALSAPFSRFSLSIFPVLSLMFVLLSLCHHNVITRLFCLPALAAVSSAASSAPNGLDSAATSAIASSSSAKAAVETVRGLDGRDYVVVRSLESKAPEGVSVEVTGQQKPYLRRCGDLCLHPSLLRVGSFWSGLCPYFPNRLFLAVSSSVVGLLSPWTLRSWLSTTTLSRRCRSALERFLVSLRPGLYFVRSAADPHSPLSLE